MYNDLKIHQPNIEEPSINYFVIQISLHLGCSDYKKVTIKTESKSDVLAVVNTLHSLDNWQTLSSVEKNPEHKLFKNILEEQLFEDDDYSQEFRFENDIDDLFVEWIDENKNHCYVSFI